MISTLLTTVIMVYKLQLGLKVLSCLSVKSNHTYTPSLIPNPSRQDWFMEQIGFHNTAVDANSSLK